MELNSPQDTRGYSMLPQASEESRYYSYGTSPTGQVPNAHSRLLCLLFLVETQWSLIDTRQFGIGNIRLTNDADSQNNAVHGVGLNIDIRPLRQDGKHLTVRYTDQQYDQEATQKLIGLFFQSGMVSRVFFNDLSIPRVMPLNGTNDRFCFDVVV